MPAGWLAESGWRWRAYRDVEFYAPAVARQSLREDPQGGALAVLIFLLLFVLGFWGHEAWRHRRALRALPIRIHVNGSRGKSSVTRLVAAALREGGIPTAAKTTGSKARFIHADGTEEPVIRLSTPNICEQIGVLDRARREGAQAIVMECMAVRPDLQQICEENIMRSTVGVITNVRPDHLDVMGPTIADVAVALSSTVPKGGTTIVGDPRHSHPIRQVSEQRHSRFLVGLQDEVTPEMMRPFSYLEHEENVAVALQVARLFHVPDDVALRGMYKATPDIGACATYEIRHNGHTMEFINIFAANDLESTIMIWRKLGLDVGGANPTFALINLRGDRVDRSLQYAEAIEVGLRADYYVLVGGIPDSVQRRFQKIVSADRLLLMGQATPQEVFDQISGRLSADRARIGGIGNIGGLGHEILMYVTAGEKALA